MLQMKNFKNYQRVASKKIVAVILLSGDSQHYWVVKLKT